SLVSILARIPFVLTASCLGKEESQGDKTCRFSIRRIKALGSRNSHSQIDNVLEWSICFLRVDGRRLHEVEKFPVLIDQRLIVGVKVRRRDSEFIWPSNFRRESVCEVFVFP